VRKERPRPSGRPGAPAEFRPDYRYVVHDLRRIAFLAGGLLIVLLALSLVLD
jgi:hypothetical protein